MDPGGEQDERPDTQERRGRELARRMAGNADEIAVTLDRIADFHEQVAREPGHPLKQQQAAEGAAAERRVAEQERNAARHYHAIADEDEEPDRPAG